MKHDGLSRDLLMERQRLVAPIQSPISAGGCGNWLTMSYCLLWSRHLKFIIVNKNFLNIMIYFVNWIE